MATKNRPKISSSPHRHFIEHLMSVTKKPPQEHRKNKKNSSFLIGRLKNNTDGHLRAPKRSYSVAHQAEQHEDRYLLCKMKSEAN
jgi:hypothetical protein